MIVWGMPKEVKRFFARPVANCSKPVRQALPHDKTRSCEMVASVCRGSWDGRGVAVESLRS